jgi:multiple sugar transport system ATP-binding protein
MAEIRIKSLTKEFAGGVVAVKDLELDVTHGSFMALLGPSGCGKTTTMNMISGLEQPTAGEIYFDDRPITRVSPGKRNVGFVFQNYAIFTHMTVYDNLAFGLKVRKEKKSKAERDADVRRVAETVGLTGSLERKAGALSVNDMQKVALGRSMIVNPAIFLLDEPFSNLDAAFRAYMRTELKRIQHELGQTMVYVTHDQVEAMSMADRIAVMNLGELQQYGSPDDVYNRPRNRFVAGFVGSTRMNFLPASLAPALAPEGRSDGVTLGIRPEVIELVAPGDARSTFDARVTLVEPLGAKDVVHLDVSGHDARVVGAPGQRPRVGDNVGLAFDPARMHRFDDETELAL